MKMSHIISLLLFTIVACTNKEEIVASKKLGDTIQLKATESVNLNDNGSVVNLKLMNIQESRCPANATCIRAGEVIVILDLQIGNENFNGLKVCIGCEKVLSMSETLQIKAKTKNYTLRLNSVDPFPQTTGIVTPTATLVLN